MIPVYVFSEGVELPKAGTYYVVTRDGVFLHKDTGLIEATVRVSCIPFLGELTPAASTRLPKLPAELIVQTLLFFRRVYQLYRSEAIVLLHYSPQELRYMLHCPLQRVSAAHVDYDSNERFDGFQLVGTIHSHAGMHAFHSGVDDSDERHFDGLHFTVGDLNQPYFTVSCTVVVNSQRFHLLPRTMIDGIQTIDWEPAPQPTYRRKGVPMRLESLFDFNLLGIEDAEIDFVTTATNKSQFYDMVLPDGRDYRSVGVPKVWLTRVSEKVYPGFFCGTTTGTMGSLENLSLSSSLSPKHERRTWK